MYRNTHIIQAIDNVSGRFKRWIFARLMGKTLARVEASLMEQIQQLDHKISPALDSINRLSDEYERRKLNYYKELRDK